MENRVFTNEQLAEMSKRTIDKVMDAIDAGETQKAKDLVNLMYDQFVHLHDGYMCWIAGLLTWIYERGGVADVEKAEIFAHQKEAKLVFLPPEQTDFEFIVKKMASELQGHVLQNMTLVEDDEKITMTNTPCGSGGRLIQMGAYKPEVGMAKIAEPSNITFNTEDYPVYCVHCPLFNINAIDATGDFLFINVPPQKDGASCQFIFYKDKSKIPAEYYTRLGKTKPHAPDNVRKPEGASGNGQVQ